MRLAAGLRVTLIVVTLSGGQAGAAPEGPEIACTDFKALIDQGKISPRIRGCDAGRRLDGRFRRHGRHDATVADAWSIMQKRQVRHLPVLDAERRLIGMLTEHDLRLVILERCLREEPGQVAHTLAGLRVNKIMTWAVVTVGPEADVRDAARTMHDRTLGALPVAAEGRVIGVITATDVIRAVVDTAGKRS